MCTVQRTTLDRTGTVRTDPEAGTSVAGGLGLAALFAAALIVSSYPLLTAGVVVGLAATPLVVALRRALADLSARAIPADPPEADHRRSGTA